MRALAIAVLCGLLGGCAFSEVTVDVNYKPGTAVPIADAGPVRLAVADGRTEDRMRISTKMNGYGNEGGAVRSSRGVTDLVQDALSVEMKAHGLDMISSGIPVSVVVRRFYCQYHTTEAVGEVVLDVSVQDANAKTVYAQTYSGTAKMPVVLFNGSNAADTVAAALQDAIGKMFGDTQFVAALSNKRTASLPQAYHN